MDTPEALVSPSIGRGKPAEVRPIEGPLTLAAALEVTRVHHPELAAAAASVEAAQGELVQAGLYPNPTIGYSAEEMGSRGGAAGKQGPFIEQELVTGGKLAIGQAAAHQAWSAEQWLAVTKRLELEAKVRAAFFEALTAQRELSENEAIVKIAAEQHEASRRFEQAGRGSRTDVIRASVELETSRTRLDTARRRLQAAWPLLAASMGIPGADPVPLQGSLESGWPEYDLEQLRDAILKHSPELMRAEAELRQAEHLLDLARAENTPNVQARLHPLYDFSESVGQVSFELGMKLPLWNKNQGNILAAQAQAARHAAQIEALRIRLSERLLSAHLRFVTAKGQAERFEKQIIPQAAEALRLSQAALEAGQIDFKYLFDVQRTLAQARLAYVQSLGDLWKASAEIEAMLQRHPPRSTP
jgi:cobalt-zinc-cadmium efflux system outer membrane protein